MKVHNIFDLCGSIQKHGVWYALWLYGFSNLWSIFVACMILRRNYKMHDEALRDMKEYL